MIIAALAAVTVAGCSRPASIINFGGTHGKQTAASPCDIANVPPPILTVDGRRALNLPPAHESLYTGLTCGDGQRFPDQCEGWRVPMVRVPCDRPHIAKLEHPGEINGLPVAAGCYFPPHFKGAWDGKTNDDAHDGFPPERITCHPAAIPRDAVIILQRPPWGIINGVKVKGGCYMVRGLL